MVRDRTPTPSGLGVATRVVAAWFVAVCLAIACTDPAPSPASSPGAEPLSALIAQWSVEPALVAELSPTGLVVDGEPVATSPDGTIARALRFDVDSERYAVPRLRDWLAKQTRLEGGWGKPVVIDVAPAISFALTRAVMVALVHHHFTGVALFVQREADGPTRSVMIQVPCFCLRPFNTLVTGHLTAVGPCDVSAIRHQVDAEHHHLEGCTSGHPTDASSVELSWLVGADGRVDVAAVGPEAVEHPSETIACWRRVVATWSAPPIDGRACLFRQRFDARRHQAWMPVAGGIDGEAEVGQPADPATGGRRELVEATLRIEARAGAYVVTSHPLDLIGPIAGPPDFERFPLGHGRRIERGADPVEADRHLYALLLDIRAREPGPTAVTIVLEPEAPFTEWMRLAELIAVRRPPTRADSRLDTAADSPAARQASGAAWRGQGEPLYPNVRLGP